MTAGCQVRASDPTIGMPFVVYHTNEDGLRWVYGMLPWFFRKLLFPHFAKKRAAVRAPRRRPSWFPGRRGPWR